MASEIKFDLRFEMTSITLVTMCMLLLTALLVTSEVKAASKQPQRSNLASKTDSLSSFTYVGMSLWPLKTTASLLTGGG